MAQDKAERLKSYLQLITGRRGLEQAMDEAASGGSGLEANESPLAAPARDGLESVLRDRDISDEQASALEALIIPKLRPAVDVVGGKFSVTHQLWAHYSSDAVIRQCIETVIPSIGRIELPGNRQFPYGGTGFIVGDGLIMTNRHVAAIFANGLGDQMLSFKSGHKAGIDFLRERGGTSDATLLVKRIVMIHPYWDMALLQVEGLPADKKPLRLSLVDVADLDNHEIAVVGYPAFDPRNDAEEQDELFDKTYGVKRLQPGQLHRRSSTESFGKIVSAAAHDCSTLGGNSGSAIFDPRTGEVLGLHFGGRYQDKNFAVPAFELARDGRVVDAGVKFAGSPAGGMPPWSDWWSREGAATVADDDSSDDRRSSTSVSAPQGRPTQMTTGGEVTLEIPLQITVRLGAGRPVTSSAVVSEAVAGGDTLEAMVEPFHDDEYDSRQGYDEDFLGVKVPMPRASDPQVLARTQDGDTTLHYEHFSIQMHAQRRLALFTASNVSADPRAKKPDPSKKYTRKALTGLGDNDQERWFLDPRLDAKFQLPDIFFTRDRKAFDKGHIIRREDVVWGLTYDELRRANGDTYHVTNCSPQTAEFNRSGSGVDNWGDLENHVLSSAAKEKLTLFAGPVLDPSDTVFVGTGGGRGNVIRARIPTRFWKVIVAPLQEGIAAFGFVLEQDLSAVEFEFVVAPEFEPHMFPLSEIEQMTGVKFPRNVLDADQFDTVRGGEVTSRAGVRRRRRRRQDA